jgi:TetR/AcrR family transcriptional regulator, cholesterol catabolism regulator
MNEKLDHLLKQAGDIFMRYGLKSVTMDDVCRELGISKKTLYQYVSDKNDLIAKVLDQDIQEDEKVICALQTSGLSAIDELLHIQKMVTEKVQHMHSSIIYDLKKYYPESWGRIIRHRNEFIVGCIEQNIIKGQQEGVFRTDIHSALIAKIYASRIEVSIDPSLYSGLKITPAEVYAEAMRYHIRGIATEKGLKYLESTQNKTNPEL